MNQIDDLQHLLPEEHRRSLVVLPVWSLRLGVLAVGLLFLGLGLVLGSNAVVGPYAFWLGLTAGVSAFLLGGFVNRWEGRLLKAFGRERVDS